jgi:hypothetical protein
MGRSAFWFQCPGPFQSTSQTSQDLSPAIHTHYNWMFGLNAAPFLPNVPLWARELNPGPQAQLQLKPLSPKWRTWSSGCTEHQTNPSDTCRTHLRQPHCPSPFKFIEDPQMSSCGCVLFQPQALVLPLLRAKNATLLYQMFYSLTIIPRAPPPLQVGGWPGMGGGGGGGGAYRPINAELFLVHRHTPPSSASPVKESPTP